MSSNRTFVVAALAALSLALGGCGASDDDGEDALGGSELKGVVKVPETCTQTISMIVISGYLAYPPLHSPDKLLYVTSSSPDLSPSRPYPFDIKEIAAYPSPLAIMAAVYLEGASLSTPRVGIDYEGFARNPENSELIWVNLDGSNVVDVGEIMVELYNP